ncbi:unnamed protein product [Caenorhabditis angaria]|uniref:HOOK N-terminal domain-containing protein n=1 Tax=Caenorhabditis angaria TaxID=860376 RepID=A0A9P1IED5_9PELO|nr:unnamed protein product [Caenorhabditis angaria]
MVDSDNDLLTENAANQAENSAENDVFQKKKEDLANLVLWFSGIDATNKNLNDPVDLVSGRAFAEILNRIDDIHFDSIWLESMPESTSRTNIVVKQSNLRKLWRKIDMYIREILRRKLETDRYFEIDSKVCGSEETDLPVALEFAMLICTLAHVGRNKEDFVLYSKDLSLKYSTEMSNVVRMITEIMRDIPEINEQRVTSDEELTSDGEFNNSNFAERSFAGKEQRISVGSNAGYKQEIEHMLKQIDDLQNHKKQLECDVESLQKHLENAQNHSIISQTSTVSSTVTADTVAILEEKNEELLKKRREAEDKINELEGQLEQIKGTLQEISDENENMKRNEKMVKQMKQEMQNTKDNLEIWREKAEKLEFDGELLKKKEKEIKDLMTQIKLLNHRLEHHVKQSTQDEGNKTEMANLRQHIGSLKADIVAKDVELVSKESTITKIEEELINLKERVKDLEDRKEELTEERNRLQEKMIKMRDSITMRSLHDSMFDGDVVEFERSDKLSLEIENQRLMERIQELESLEPLKGEILTLKSRNSVLEQETQIAHKQIDEKQKEIQELMEKLEKNQQTTSGGVVELKVQLEKISLSEEKALQNAEKAEKKLAEIQLELDQKTEEMKKFEQILNKSKIVIDGLEEQLKMAEIETSGNGQTTSVQQFKQLQAENEKLERKVSELENQLHTAITSYEQENRLLTSAAHQIVLNRSAEEVLYSPQSANSTLSHQKQPSALSWRVSLLLIIIPLLMILTLCGVSSFLAPPNA